MGAALPVLLAHAVTRLKAQSPRATVLVEEGDLTHLLPRLRLSELDVIVGRLEPAYAAPDLVTEPLYEEPMVAIVGAGHPLAGKARPDWAGPRGHALRAAAAVGVAAREDRTDFLPARPAAARRVMESSSYLAVTTFVAQRGAAGFVARSVGQQLEAEGRFHVLPLDVEVALPPWA